MSIGYPLASFLLLRVVDVKSGKAASNGSATHLQQQRKRSRKPQIVCLPRSSMNRSRFLRACRLSSAPGEHPKIESVAACCRGRNTSKRASVGKRGRAVSTYQRAAQRMTRDGENTAVCRASSTTQNAEEGRFSSTTRPRC
jgi:hypothetical protein